MNGNWSLATLALSLILILVVVAGLVLMAGGAAGGASQTPMAESDMAVVYRPSYSDDIAPIFERYCVECHGSDEAPNGLRLDNYEGVLRGTRHGPVVVPGSPDLSNLLVLIKREASAQVVMPYHESPLSRNRIKTIENWVGLGAPNN